MGAVGVVFLSHHLPAEHEVRVEVESLEDVVERAGHLSPGPAGGVDRVGWCLLVDILRVLCC